jgi:hypothetical protein
MLKPSAGLNPEPLLDSRVAVNSSTLWFEIGRDTEPQSLTAEAAAALISQERKF